MRGRYRPQVRYPTRPTLASVFAYLVRAYPAEPQPVAGIIRAIDFLEEQRFWFVTGDQLECMACGKTYRQPRRAERHRRLDCPSGGDSHRANSTILSPTRAFFAEVVFWDSSRGYENSDRANSCADAHRPQTFASEMATPCGSWGAVGSLDLFQPPDRAVRSRIENASFRIDAAALRRVAP